MKKIIVLALIMTLTVPFQLQAQEKEKKKGDTTGFVPGGVPAIAYDTDLGFLYGIILNFYFYGDGTRYPKYDHSIYLEWSRTTKGTGNNVLRFDSDRIIPGVRTLGEVSYYTEQALDFYGFNGYKTYYNPDYEDDSPDNPDYLSRLFFRLDRKMLRLRTDFTGDIIGNKLKWFGGIEFYNTRIDTVNIDKLNKGKSEDKKLPGVGGGLYGRYAYNWDIIPQDQINGGTHTLIKAGLIYDTRDNEPNPMKGIWTEAQLQIAPSFLSNRNLTYTRLVITHRQYFTLIPRDLNLVYRISYQAKLTGEMPFYMLPFIFNSPPSWTRDGIGGSKTMRGIMRDRVVGEDYLFGNVEMRWKFLYFTLWKWNVYLALNGFMDGGMVTGEYKINTDNVPANMKYFFPDEKETLHLSAGGGLHIALNQNFIIAADYGHALDKRDGKQGFYIGLDFLF